MTPFMVESRAAVQALLEARLPAAETSPPALHRAMRHAVLGGGKRLRPMLVLAAVAAVMPADGPAAGRTASAGEGGREAAGRTASAGEGGREAVGAGQSALLAAAAIELVHAYSLVHDDLPAMDNADLRHGVPAVHRAFGAATAILAGDALLTLAFEWLAEVAWPTPEAGLRASADLARAAGAAGMVGGQQLDLDDARSEDAVRAVHERKTGALFGAALRIGGLVAAAPDALLAALDAYARPFGLAFQIIDDVLDVEGDANRIGKPVGGDREAGKVTYIDLLGVEGARQRAAEAINQALAVLAQLPGNTQPLADIARFVIARDL